MRKLYSFLSKNTDCSCAVKRKMWISALHTAILYSSETWLISYIRSVDTPSNNTLKQLLAVRHTTYNDIVYVETGEPNVKTIILDKQVKFLKKLRSRATYYITKAIHMAIQTRSLIGRRIQYLENNLINHCMQFQIDIQTRIQNSDILSTLQTNVWLKFTRIA